MRDDAGTWPKLLLEDRAELGVGRREQVERDDLDADVLEAAAEHAGKPSRHFCERSGPREKGLFGLSLGKPRLRDHC